MREEKDRNGLSFYFQYDGNDPFAKCVRTWGDAGLFDRLIDYDEPNRKTFVVDSHGATTVYQRDELGQVIAETDPMQQVKRYEYDPDSGQLSAFIDERGRETRSDFDTRGNVVAKVKPDGTRIAFEYDQDQLVRMVDEIGGAWLFQYTRDGRLRRATDPMGAVTTWTWKRGLLHEIRDAMGAVTAFAYDDAKNLCKIKYPTGGEERFEHDACGRWTKIWDALDALTKCKRDALGRIVEVFEPDGNHRRLKYDAEGNVLEAIDLARRIKLTRTVSWCPVAKAHRIGQHSACIGDRSAGVRAKRGIAKIGRGGIPLRFRWESHDGGVFGSHARGGYLGRFWSAHGGA